MAHSWRYSLILIDIIKIAEPTDVEKSADELWLGEKFQSNSELAGSPRNALRRSGDDELSRGKATVSMRAAKAVPSRGKLRIHGMPTVSQWDYGREVP